MSSGRIGLVVVWLIGIGAWASVYFVRYGEHTPHPQTIFMEGQPVSYLISGVMPPEPEEHKPLTRAEILERVKATSPGRPFGHGEYKRLNTFRYIYREITPSTVKSDEELVAIADEIIADVEKAGALHGRAFVLVPESTTGWLYAETVRVCLPVADSVQAPPNTMVGTFEGAMVAIRGGATTGDQGNTDEMDRWAEVALLAATGKEPDFSGPFIMTINKPEPGGPGQITWDWMIPVGPLPAARQLSEAEQAPGDGSEPAAAHEGVVATDEGQ